MEKLIEKFKYYEIIKYFILVDLGKVERDSKLEEMYSKYLDDYSNFLVKGMYAFRENFCRSIHVNPITTNIKKYGDQAYYYLLRTYPYSLELGGCTNIRDLDEALAYYTLSRGGDTQVASNIGNVLKDVKLTVIGNDYEENLHNNDHVVAYTDVDSIVGSTLPYYQGENLYDTLVKLDDKCIARYFECIVMHTDALDGICCYEPERGVYYVSEGNHRIMAKKAMDIIDLITGTVPMTKYPVKIEVSRKKDLYNGFGF